MLSLCSASQGRARVFAFSLQNSSPVMAHQKDAEVDAMLRSIRESGRYDIFLQALRAELNSQHDEFELLSDAGSMSDASKRRGDETSPLDAPRAKQRPQTPGYSGGSSTVNETGSFPPGIDSLETWGCTILETGKYAKQGFTYFELSSSQDPEMKRYCAWMLSQKDRSDLNAEIKDFVKYLVLKSESSEASQSYFPGSTVVRRLRHG